MKYETPEMEVIVMTSEDIITSSNVTDCNDEDE